MPEPDCVFLTEEEHHKLARNFAAALTPFVIPVYAAPRGDLGEEPFDLRGSCVILEIAQDECFLLTAGHVMKKERKNLGLSWWEGTDMRLGFAPVVGPRAGHIFYVDDKDTRRRRVCHNIPVVEEVVRGVRAPQNYRVDFGYFKLFPFEAQAFKNNMRVATLSMVCLDHPVPGMPGMTIGFPGTLDKDGIPQVMPLMSDAISPSSWPKRYHPAIHHVVAYNPTNTVNLAKGSVWEGVPLPSNPVGISGGAMWDLRVDEKTRNGEARLAAIQSEHFRDGDFQVIVGVHVARILSIIAEDFPHLREVINAAFERRAAEWESSRG